MRIKNQRLMTFSENVDETRAKSEHKFYFSFSRDYLKGKKILDIGSWTGPFEKLIYDLAQHITAVDIESRALRVLKKNLPRVTTVKAFSHRLPFKSQIFDVVCFFDVIEHIPQGYELTTLLEINRVLKRGGYLFLATPYKNFWANLLDPAYWLVGHRHYAREALSLMLIEAGFKVESIKITGSLFTSLYAISFYFFKHILRMKVPTIGFIERKMEQDMMSKGFTQIAVRARKIK